MEFFKLQKLGNRAFWKKGLIMYPTKHPQNTLLSQGREKNQSPR